MGSTQNDQSVNPKTLACYQDVKFSAEIPEIVLFLPFLLFKTDDYIYLRTSMYFLKAHSSCLPSDVQGLQ